MNNDFSWNNGGSQLAVGALAIGMLLLNKKTNDLSVKCGKGFKQIAEDITKLEAFKDASYDNFKILAKDINRLGSAIGFKGKLGVNN